MGKIYDRTGNVVFGIEFLNYSGRNNRGKVMWLCRCHCGKEFVKEPGNITSGNTKSCGCQSQAKRKGVNKGKKNAGYRHGETKSRLYGIWSDMRNRCNNENNQAYQYYGAKGIKVCQEWDDYIVFREWAHSTGYTEDLTIERLDVYGNYSPDNCSWASRQEQVRNRGANKNSKSGVVGVTWNKPNKNWIARIKNSGVIINLGSFKNLQDAIEARKQGEIKHWGKEYQDFETILRQLK